MYYISSFYLTKMSKMVFSKKLCVNIFIILFKSCFIATSPEPRIFLKNPTSPHSPYMAAVIKDSNLQDRCGGALISESYVLTAAQCVKGHAVEVILGVHDIGKYEKQHHYKISEKDVIIHPSFDSITLDNDIALIKLPKAAEIGQHIQTIDVPSKENELFIGKTAILTGWIRTFFGYADKLSQAHQVVVSNKICKRPFHLLSDQKLCARVNLLSNGLGKLGCTDGNPLIIKGDTDLLVGIVSSKTKICLPILPNVFTRVNSYKTWIDNEIKSSQVQENEQETVKPGNVYPSVVDTSSLKEEISSLKEETSSEGTHIPLTEETSSEPIDKKATDKL